MATDTAGNFGQEYPQNLVHYIAKTVTFADDDAVVTVGYLPPNASVIDAGVHVTTAFSAGTAVIDVGVSGADTDAYVSAASLTTAGVIKDTALATMDDFSTSAITVEARVTSDDVLASGSAIVYVLYVLADR